MKPCPTCCQDCGGVGQTGVCMHDVDDGACRACRADAAFKTINDIGLPLTPEQQDTLRSWWRAHRQDK